MHRHHHQFNQDAARLSRVEGSPPAGVFAVVSYNASHHIRKAMVAGFLLLSPAEASLPITCLQACAGVLSSQRRTI
jgi:hypothetical protein